MPSCGRIRKRRSRLAPGLCRFLGEDLVELDVLRPWALFPWALFVLSAGEALVSYQGFFRELCWRLSWGLYSEENPIGGMETMQQRAVHRPAKND